MNQAGAQQLLETTLAAQWSSCKLVYENVEGKDWSSGGQPYLIDGTQPFAVLAMKNVTEAPITVPLGCIRASGILVVTFKAKKNSGTRVLSGLKDAMRALLSYQSFWSGNDELRFHESAEAGVYEVTPGWIDHVINFRFHYNRERT